MALTYGTKPSLLLLLLLLLTTACPASGELRLLQPPRPPRVYAGAPSGVDVTVVRAVDDAHLAAHSAHHAAAHSAHLPDARYYLYESRDTDNQYFTIDEYDGNITTARYLDRVAGEQYQVIVVALVSGNATNQKLAISVTHYNQHDPRLSLQHYSAEVVVGAEVGAQLLTVEGADDDRHHYNRRLRYFLADPELPFHLDPFLETPRWSPVSVDMETGSVWVSGELNLTSSPLRLLVGAVDGGSPQRYALANLTVYVRNMSAPRGVDVLDTTETSMRVCWSPPNHGRPQGYVLNYTPALGQRSYGKGSLNLTLHQLHSRVMDSSGRPEEGDEGRTTEEDAHQQQQQEEKEVVVDGVTEIYRYCAIVGGLASWTEYVVGVRAWDGDQVSMAAVPVFATTRRDYCAEGVCGEGNCTLRQSTAGYMCSCHSGYYGSNCEHHNPCLPHNPCMHLGKCQNASDGSYTCECLRGFYGTNCTRIDPCAAISLNPCSNGGTCISQESGQYTCLCPKGYFGVTCEHHDPCVSNPCQHGGSCTNLTHTTFTCRCAPGYRGKLCHAEINECVPNPCARGHCIDRINDFRCQCPQGWGGKLCDEDLDECASSPCLNGATCIDGLASFVCDCAYGYNGEKCEIPESCPVQSTLLDTGEFHWPATRHGESVILACPYGIRASASDTISTSKKEVLLGTTTATTIIEDSLTSGLAHEMSLEYKDGSSLPSTLLPPSMGITTHAEWKGGSFRINRRARDVELPESDHKINPITSDPEVNDDETRRRTVAANLRGSHPRQSRRRLHQWRQHGRVGQTTEGTDKQIQVTQDFEPHAEERPFRRQFRYRERSRIQKEPNISEPPLEHDNLPEQPQTRNAPTAEPRIGDRFIYEQSRRGTQLEQVQKKLSEDVEISDAEPRVGKDHFNQQQIEREQMEQPYNGQKHSAPSRLEMNKFEHQKILENNAEELKTDHPELPKIERSHSESTRNEEFYKHFPSGQDFPGKVIIGETLAEMPTRTVRKSIHVSDPRNSQNEPIQISKDTDAVTTLITLNGRYQKTKGFTEERGNEDSNQRMDSSLSSGVRSHSFGAIRLCKLLSNGSVAWEEPDTSMCRGKAMQVAEDAAKDVASLTASPATVNPQMFTRAANQLAVLVEHALHDPAVANNMVSALSNMMEVNDSVVAEGDKENNVTSQLVNTINTFAENVVVEIGKSVEFRSSNLVVEARLLESSAEDNITFTPKLEVDDNFSDDGSLNRRKRNADSTTPAPLAESYMTLPPQVLKKAGTKHVRLEFVSYSNDKFFRGNQSLGMPVITARVTNTVISNLTEPIVYHIPTATTGAEDSYLPVCVFWDELAHEWSKVGMKTVIVDGKTTCQATHLTAFSILLDPIPSSFGVHGEALSIITYVGLALSTAGLTATVATYAIFRTLNRDRSGKIVMNLSLALLLLNLVFIVAVQLKPPSVACTALAAALHYLVVAAFAWMLVEAANMYQLLITVFASAETHFMAKRVIAAWGIPIIVVVAALFADVDVYGDEDHGFCVISPYPNPVVYYSTYMGPICCVLLVNCIVFVMVTRVVCQRRPRSHKPRSPSSTPTKDSPITLAQVRGAVTVVALLGVTWVAGAFSVGWVRITLQYIFCVTTPLQGMIIFIVRVAQHPEARAAWITLFTTGTLRRRPPTTHTHSTHSSAHTHSTSSSALTPPRNNHSSVRTVSTRISPRTSIKPSTSVKRNGTAKNSSSKNGSVHKYTSNSSRTEMPETSMTSLFSRLINRFSNRGLDHQKPKTQENITDTSTSSTKPTPEIMPSSQPQLDYPSSHQESFFSEKFLQKSSHHSNKNGSLYRPQSLVLLRTDSHAGVSTNQPSISKDYNGCQLPALLSGNVLSQELLEAGIPPSMIPGRSLGSLMLLSEGKEGDDTSWHFIRPPPDGRSDAMNEEENAFEAADQILQVQKEHKGNIIQAVQTVRTEEPLSSGGCVVLAGQRVATKNSIVFSGQQKGTYTPAPLTRANSELQVGSAHVNPSELRRSASVYTLGEWEDPRSSLA